MLKRVMGVSLILMACQAPADMEALPEVSADRIEQHLRTLSADEFAGRSPGTAGGDMAAEYIAERFQEAGLKPIGGGYFQTVPIIGSTPDPSRISLSFRAGDQTIRPEYLDDFVLLSGDPEAESSAGSGELVFVGYGITAPENEWNDFGVDVSGKYILVLVNDPPAPTDEPDLFGGPAMTYYGRWTYKYEEAARQGALGVFIVHTTDAAGYPWAVVRGGWSGEQFALPPDPSAPAPTPLQGWLSYETAAGVLAGAGYDLADLMQQASSRDFQAVATGVQVDASVASTIRRVETMNVVGLLTGSVRPDEVITITSHYDHLGVGEAIDGDSIYNGAYDNASGTAVLISVAYAFNELETPPDRSLLFIATAAEEQGLLGAAWYVQSPLVPLAHTVAEINVDEANLWGDTDDVIVMGAERSELGPFAEARAAELGMKLAPDAEPEKGFFFRSDHFPFAKAGIPSLYINHGREYRGRPPGWGDEIQADYTANRYHGPEDEYSEDFVYDGAVQQGNVIFRIALDIARSTAWPNWYPDSEFRAARDAMRPGG
jgi:Zn-dependent M28 family amino/carboxypeptidase